MANYKDLPARSWPKLRDQWIEHIPLEFTAMGGSVEPLLNLQGVSLGDKIIIERVPQLRETILALSFHLRLKGLYCIRAAREMNEKGYPTWATLLMYDACFFSAKSICYLLGMSDVGRDSPYYLDIFYEETRKKQLIDVGHQAFRLPERMSHSVLWSLFTRLMNTLKSDENDFTLRIKEMRRNDFATFSSERNRLFYTCLAWSREENLDTSDFREPRVYDDNMNFFNDPLSGTSEYFHQYNHGGLAIFACLTHLMNDLGERVPSVAAFLKEQAAAPSVNSFDFS